MRTNSKRIEIHWTQREMRLILPSLIITYNWLSQKNLRREKMSQFKRLGGGQIIYFWKMETKIRKNLREITQYQDSRDISIRFLGNILVRWEEIRWRLKVIPKGVICLEIRSLANRTNYWRESFWRNSPRLSKI